MVVDGLKGLGTLGRSRVAACGAAAGAIGSGSAIPVVVQ
jgi:hypothetical protein